jgi:hypothetical protein
MSEEIKLGWYRSRIPSREQGEVVYAAMKEVVIRNQTGDLFIWSANSIRDNYKYIGPELPPQGEWVDPGDVTIERLKAGIKARFWDDGGPPAEEGVLVGFDASSGYPYLSCINGVTSSQFSQCQVWSPK